MRDGRGGVGMNGQAPKGRPRLTEVFLVLVGGGFAFVLVALLLAAGMRPKSISIVGSVRIEVYPPDDAP